MPMVKWGPVMIQWSNETQWWYNGQAKFNKDKNSKMNPNEYKNVQFKIQILKLNAMKIIIVKSR